MKPFSFKIVSESLSRENGYEVSCGEFIVKQINEESFGIYAQDGMKLDDFFSKNNAAITAERIANEYASRMNDMPKFVMENTDVNQSIAYKYSDTYAIGGIYATLKPGCNAVEFKSSMNHVVFQTTYSNLHNGRDIQLDFIYSALPSLRDSMASMQQAVYAGDWKVKQYEWKDDELNFMMKADVSYV